MKRMLEKLIVTVAGLMVVALVACSSDETAETSRAGGGAGAVRAVLDPDTGLPTSDPDVVRRVLEASRAERPLSSQERLRFRHEGLFEETHPNGMIFVDLQGRFAAPLIAELPDPSETDDEDVLEGSR